ncbi:MAG: hypothetical protein JKY37_08700 [Nannocystaceae bacterium]|nr:hypothetical protein [Nannocystaceae bacterium]
MAVTEAVTRALENAACKVDTMAFVTLVQRMTPGAAMATVTRTLDSSRAVEVDPTQPWGDGVSTGLTADSPLWLTARGGLRSGLVPRLRGGEQRTRRVAGAQRQASLGDLGPLTLPWRAAFPGVIQWTNNRQPLHRPLCMLGLHPPTGRV